MWACTGSLSRGNKDTPSEARGHAMCTCHSLAQSSPPCWSSLLGGTGALSIPALSGLLHSSLSTSVCGHWLLCGTSAARLCGLKRECGGPLCHRNLEQPKAQDARLSCLEVCAAALCHLESRGDCFLKAAVSSPLSHLMQGMCGGHLTSPNLKVREMHCWEQIHIPPFQGREFFRQAQRTSPQPLYCFWRREREASSPTLQQTN